MSLPGLMGGRSRLIGGSGVERERREARGVTAGYSDIYDDGMLDNAMIRYDDDRQSTSRTTDRGTQSAITANRGKPPITGGQHTGSYAKLLMRRHAQRHARSITITTQT